MKKILTVLCSVPIILIVLYFIPFLGVVLIIFRDYFKKQEKYKLPLLLLITAITIFIPKLIYLVINSLSIKVSIPYLDRIISSNIYGKLIIYGKTLIIIGVLYLIIRYVITNIYTKARYTLNSKIGDFIEKNEKQAYKIQKENDLKLKEKQEKAKNTHFISCPTCGKDNVIYGDIGKCTHCRRTIVYKEKTNIKKIDNEDK